MRRFALLVVVALVMATMMALAGPAFADHAHNLITPGTTVEDIGRGQTEKCATEPGGHQFHNRVHFGTPGTFAFPKSGNVSVIRTEPITC
jgi:hypothetical protein